jgi:AraC-like DNA-binding protein
MSYATVVALLGPILKSEFSLRALAALAEQEGSPVTLDDLATQLGCSKAKAARVLYPATLIGLVDSPGYGPHAGQRRMRRGGRAVISRLVAAASRVSNIRGAAERGV